MFIFRAHSGLPEKATPQEKASSDEVKTSFVVLPYVKGVSERVSNVLRNNGVKVDFQPLNTLHTCFRRPKGKLATFLSRRVVYKVYCLNCDFVYYG